MTECACLRATPSGAPRPASTRPSPAPRSSSRPAVARRSRPWTSPARTTLEVVSRGKHMLHRLERRPDPALPPADGGPVAGRRDAGGWPRGWRRNPTAAGRGRHRRTGPPSGCGSACSTSSRPATRAASSDTSVPTCSGPTGTSTAPSDRVAAPATPDRRRPCSTSATSPASAPCGAAETLFLERVQPWTPAAELGPTTVERVVARAHRLIDIGRRHAVQSSTGSYRRDEAHYVHARSGVRVGGAARRCGSR